MHDPFAVLGLARGASAAEIKRAFRKLAMAWHPDRNPTRAAEERFKEIKSACELLLDADAFAAWEAERAAHAGARDDAHADAAGGKDDAARRRRRQSRPREETRADEPGDDAPADRDVAHLTLHLDLEEAARGCTRTITLASERVCPTCAGAGRHEHAHSVACAECKGIGRVRRGSGHCAACGGRGYVRVTLCPDCGGRGVQETTRQLEVRIPAAALPGERLRLARQHRPRANEAPADLFIAIAIRPHPVFTLAGRDLECTVPVGIFALLHGGPIEVPTLAGTTEVEIPPYTGNGLTCEFAGLGYPGRHGRGAGKLRLALTPVFPAWLGDAERKLLARLDRAMHADAGRSAPALAAWEAVLSARRGGGRPG